MNRQQFSQLSVGDRITYNPDRVTGTVIALLSGSVVRPVIRWPDDIEDTPLCQRYLSQFTLETPNEAYERDR